MDVSVPGCDNVRQSLGQFGSRRIYGCIDSPHTDFTIAVSGKVKTGLEIFEEFCEDPLESAVFRVQSGLTQPGPAIRAFHDSLDLCGSAYDRAMAIRKAVHEAFSYQPGATSAHESGEDAFARKQGVCQDYAHVMLSLLRMEGIPARYVTGMLVGEEPPTPGWRPCAETGGTALTPPTTCWWTTAISGSAAGGIPPTAPLFAAPFWDGLFRCSGSRFA